MFTTADYVLILAEFHGRTARQSGEDLQGEPPHITEPSGIEP